MADYIKVKVMKLSENLFLMNTSDLISNLMTSVTVIQSASFNSATNQFTFSTINVKCLKDSVSAANIVVTADSAA
jgi:hypothetical protein